MKIFIAIVTTCFIISAISLYKLNQSSSNNSEGFTESLARIARHVNESNYTWKAYYPPEWADKTYSSFSKQASVKPMTEEHRKNFKKSEILEYPDLPDNLPVSFDAREQWPNCDSIKDVRDQSDCGSCWAISSAGAMSDRICIASGQKDQRRISGADMVSCCKSCGDGCEGGWPDKAYQYWQTDGYVTGNAYADKTQWCKPYPFPPCAHHMSSDKMDSCPTDGTMYPTPKCEKKCDDNYKKSYKEDLIKAKSSKAFVGEPEMLLQLVTEGPFVACFTVYDDFLVYKSGVWQHVPGFNGDHNIGDHAVRVIGYGVENGVPYWLIVNSWNELWGDKGLFKVVRGINHAKIEGALSSGIPDL